MNRDLLDLVGLFDFAEAQHCPADHFGPQRQLHGLYGRLVVFCVDMNRDVAQLLDFLNQLLANRFADLMPFGDTD